MTNTSDLDEHPTTGQLLEDVVRAHHALANARSALDDAVYAARLSGASYAKIGDVLGVSRQAVWERFGRVRTP